jgi:hypothetical protein
MLFAAAAALAAAWLTLAVKDRQVLAGAAYCLAATLALVGLASS